MKKLEKDCRTITNTAVLFKLLTVFCSLLSYLTSAGQYIAAGNDFSVTICNDGNVRACGKNTNGGLGDSSTVSKSTPVQVHGLSNITAVSTGDLHTIYLKSNGLVYGCGRNGSGELGDNTNVSRIVPVPISSLSNVKAISAGQFFSLFLKSDSTVWATGANSMGQLGISSTQNKNFPNKIPTLSGVVAISAGSEHSLFLKSDGTVWACGQNNIGQLGDSTTTNRLSPVQVHNLSGIVAISAGYQFSMFLKNDGTVWTCGRNDFGQLSNGTTDSNPHTLPAKSNYINGVAKILSGYYHALFLKTDGSVWACGNNDYGKLGDGTYIARNIPVRLSSMSGVIDLEGGWGHSLFLKNDGTVLACGYNNAGGLGNDTTSQLNPVPMPMSTCITGNPRGVAGNAFVDLNQNCTKNAHESVLFNRAFIINPGNIVVQTANSGGWYLDSLPAGSYSITTDTTGNWLPLCPVTQNFTVLYPDSFTAAPGFGFIPTKTCPAPDVSVFMPRMRPGFSNQPLYIQTCNLYSGTDTLRNPYVVVNLDPAVILQTASIPYTALSNNTYRFDISNIGPANCYIFLAMCSVSVNTMIGRSLCITANLFPQDTCVFDTVPSLPSAGVSPCTLPYDGSNIEVEGACNSNTIYFKVMNTGTGNMQCFSAVRLYVDGHWSDTDSVKLNAGDSTVFSYTGDGKTWRLEVDQHPLHLGASYPNATIEACGNIQNWTPNLVNNLPLDDADPIIDIYCGVVRSSYDPNQKTGYPTGTGAQNYISANEPLEYTVEFQNTGTDTAFTVVLRDTLNANLDIFSVKPGVSSHPYTFKMYGTKILEWTFENILLPDSNTNEPASHGFATFSVKQKPNLADGTIITNKAGIYFDFNSPVLTNTASHQIHKDNLVTLVKELTDYSVNNISVYPNPTTDILNVVSYDNVNTLTTIFNLQGQAIIQNITSKKIDVSNLQSGIYIAQVMQSGVIVRKRWVKM